MAMVALVALVGVAASGCQLEGAIAGVVVDGQNGLPLAGAAVDTTPRTRIVRTDRSGRFRIERVPAGSYGLLVSGDRHVVLRTTVVVRAAATTELHFSLRPVENPAGPEIVIDAPIEAVGFDAVAVLDASRSRDPKGRSLRFVWRQLAGLTSPLSPADGVAARVELRTPPLARDEHGVGRPGPRAIGPALAAPLLFELTVTTPEGGRYGRQILVPIADVQPAWPRAVLGVDRYLDCGDLLGPWKWEIVERPLRSTAKLWGDATCTPRLRPDAAGVFVVREQRSGTLLRLVAGKWFGGSSCGRPDCHPRQALLWKGTRHATVFARGVSGQLGPRYDATCLPCHTLGYSLTANNAGFDEAMLLGKWLLPPGPAPGIWERIPKEVQDKANVQCEACHGPGRFYVGHDDSICAQCHDLPPRYPIHEQLRLGATARLSPAAWPELASSECAGCHTARGFAVRLRGEQVRLAASASADVGAGGGAAAVPSAAAASVATAAWSAVPATSAPLEPVAGAHACLACHAPHEPRNPGELRLADRALIPAGFETSGAGMGAVCMACHNAGLDPQQPAALRARRAPHPGAQTEILCGRGGFLPAGAAAPVDHLRVAHTCVGCHMAPTPGEGAASHKRIGGHSLRTRDADLGNELPGLCGPCHKGDDRHDPPALRDHDGDGQRASFKQEIGGLLDGARAALGAAARREGVQGCGGRVASGVGSSAASATDRHGFAAAAGAVTATAYRRDAIVYLGADGRPLRDCQQRTLPVRRDDVYRAAYNYLLVRSDGSLGLHNPGYVVALLRESLRLLGR